MKTYSLFSFVLSTMLFVVSINAQAEHDIRYVKVGEIDFYAIVDGPKEIANDAIRTEDQDKDILKRLTPSGKSPSCYALFLVKKGPDAVLIDTGTGGHMLKHLQTLGIKPNEIKTVILTHSHGDHVGGLIKDGQKVFPNAEIRLHAAELDFWQSARNKELCEQVIKMYGTMKFLVPDEKTSIVFPEMVAVDLAGHTPGHTGFLISSKGTKLLLVADLLHSTAIQFAAPEVNFRFDNNPNQSAAIRRKTLQRAADEKLLFVGSHIPFPCAGYVKTDGNACRFVPLQTEDEQPSYEKVADALITRFAKADFSDVDFTQTMKDAKASDVTKALWNDFTKQFGPFVKSQVVKTESLLEFQRVHEQCDFENGTAVLMVVVDQNDLVAGLFVMSTEKKGQ